jgi:hypothetical protein
MAIKTIYDELVPDVKVSLQESARKYDSAKRLKYILMSKTIWSELTVTELNELITYSDLNSYELSSHSFMYGHQIIQK